MKKRAALGIDIGGTKTLCILVDHRCRPIEFVKFKTAPQEGRARFTRNLLHSVTTLHTAARQRGLSLVGIGIGCAGSVDKKKVSIGTSLNMLRLQHYPIGKILRRVVPVEVSIGNDVQVGIYAEHKLGAAMGCENVLGAFFGTGVGGAAIINGEVYTGASGLGGQIGCILAQPVGGPKAALSHGIVDRIASKTAIAGEALVMAVKEWAPYLHKKVGTDLSKVTWGILKRAIAHGDTCIDEMLRARMRVVGIALSSVVNFLNPELVILGGGLINELPELAQAEIEAGMREYLAPEVSQAMKVKPAKLGSDAVALGGAYMALERSKTSQTKY